MHNIYLKLKAFKKQVMSLILKSRFAKPAIISIGVLSITLLSVIIFSKDGISAKLEKPWEKVCEESNDEKKCRIVQTQFLSKLVDGKQQAVGRVLGLTILYVKDETGNDVPYMSISLPLGVDLRRGAVLKVDKNGKDIPLQFLQCNGSGCDSSIKLDEDLIKSFKQGKNITFGFVPWGSNNVTLVNASLVGFTKAFKSIRP